jgi:universal stress protein A
MPFAFCCVVQTGKMKGAAMFRIKTILFPTDFSKSAERAFQVAGSLALDHDARVIVMHVVPPSVVMEGVVLPPPPPEDYEERIRTVFKKLQTIDPRYANVRIETRLVQGEPADEILRASRETLCDMIVMGTHGRSGLGRLLMGSVAELVLRKATCPVLTVKTPLDKTITPSASDSEELAQVR